MGSSTGLAIADLPTAFDPDLIGYVQHSDLGDPLGWGPGSEIASAREVDETKLQSHDPSPVDTDVLTINP